MIKENNNWLITESDFPESEDLIEQIKFVLKYAILAPSTHNSQPWLFKINGDCCQIFLNNHISLPKADPKGRDNMISIGCLIENLVISSKYFGIYKEVKYVNGGENNLVAEIYFQNSSGKNYKYKGKLIAISKRLNARGFFNKQTIPESVILECMNTIKKDNIILDLITSQEDVKKLAQLTAQGIIFAHNDKYFRKELASWLRHNLSKKLDGLFGYNLRMPLLFSFILPIFIKYFNAGKILSRLNFSSLKTAPLIGVFSTLNESQDIWLDIGRLFQNISLILIEHNIYTSVYVGAIEMGNLRIDIKDLLMLDETPQFLFAAGFMSGSFLHSPRHKLDDKLL